MPKTKKKEMSPRQECMLHFIEKCIATRKRPPSIREICDECGISSTSVADYNLNRLAELGYIDRTSKVSRGIEVIRPVGAMLESEQTINVPVYGKIAAGDPIYMPDSDVRPEEFVELARNLLKTPKSKKLFALRVEGQSMVDALVDDGDIVVLSHQETANNGDMVAAWIESREEWTLKKFFQSGETVTLRPANPAMFTEEVISQRFTFPAQDVKVSGKVCLVVRQM
jgi:repressor LexA